jgi:hypothetical protein
MVGWSTPVFLKLGSVYLDRITNPVGDFYESSTLGLIEPPGLALISDVFWSNLWFLL